MTEELNTSGLSRRDMLKLLLAAGLTPSVASLIAACQPAAAPATPGTGAPGTTPGKTPAATKPQVGGAIRIDTPADPISLDPLRFNAVEGQRVYRLTNSQVLRWREEDRSLEPLLAAAMPEVSNDRLTYTIKLRTGVQWHDGQPFDSSDVKFSYDIVMNPESASVWRAAFASVESVEAPDAETVVVRLREPFTPQMSKFAMIPIISSKIPYTQNETYASTLVGTGPYKFVEWQRGTQIVLERNPDYFEENLPYIERLTFRVVQENAARVTNIANDQTQIVPEAPNNQVEVLRQRGVNVEIPEASASRVYAYPSFQEGRPTADVNLRKAIAWAIDRGLIADQVYNGAAVPASTYLSSGSQYFNEELGTFFGSEPDLDRAREFLQAAGGPPQGELEFVTQNLPDLVEVATIVQSNLREIGINVRVSAEEVAAFLPKLLGGDYDLLMIRAPVGSSSGFSPDYPYLGYFSTSPSNFNKFTDPRMDELLTEAVQAPEGEEARAAWEAVQEYDLETLGQIQFVTARYVEAYSPSLQNYSPSALYALYNIPGAYLAT